MLFFLGDFYSLHVTRLKLEWFFWILQYLLCSSLGMFRWTEPKNIVNYSQYDLGGYADIVPLKNEVLIWVLSQLKSFCILCFRLQIMLFLSYLSGQRSVLSSLLL